ncbi:hypothetical protein FRC03_006733 [Tulasnella sp. 419]|nr:hypothetical protein FRC03_006733 [Tulasnella sp. 419]
MNIITARLNGLRSSPCSFLYTGAARQMMTGCNNPVRTSSASELVRTWRTDSRPFTTTFKLLSANPDAPSSSTVSPALQSQTRKRNKRKYDHLFAPPPPTHLPLLVSQNTGRVYDAPQNFEQLTSITLALLRDMERKPEDKWAEESDNFISNITQYARRPTPYTGRTVAVTTSSRSTTEAFKKAYYSLNSVLRKNNVFAMVRAQARHEKKGYKRRRLASQTHRRKFAQMVRQKVALVEKIRKRGG